MIACPKCESQNVMTAPDEAPAWAKVWMKCFACGKRWDQAGGKASAIGDDDHEPLEESSVATKRTGDDIVKLVMDLSRGETPVPKKEKTMARCTKGKCPENAAEDSVRCPKHRDEQRASNAKHNGRVVATGNGTTPRKYAFKTRKPAVTVTPPSDLPTMHTARTAPMTLAEPRIVNPPSRMADVDGNAVTILDSFIGKLQVDLQVLRAAKEIMERHG